MNLGCVINKMRAQTLMLNIVARYFISQNGIESSLSHLRQNSATDNIIAYDTDDVINFCDLGET